MQQRIHEVDRYIIPIRALSYNRYYRIFRNRYVISKEGQVFRQQVNAFFNQIEDKRCHDSKIKLTIDFYLKTKREADNDNLLKGIIDSCKDILFTDDKLIYEIHTRKFIDSEINEIHIEIEKLDV